MAVAVDTRNAGGSNAGGTTLSWTHTVNAGLTNSVLIVCAGNGATTQKAATAVDWDDGGANTPLVSYGSKFDTGGNCCCEIWSLLAPASGSKTIKVTYSPTANFGIGAASASYQNVDQAGPFRATITSAASLNSAISQAVASAVGDIVIDCAMDNAGGTLPTQGGSQTLIQQTSPGGNIDVGVSDQVGAASVTMGWTGAFSSSNWAWVAGSIKASTGGGGAVFPAAIISTPLQY